MEDKFAKTEIQKPENIVYKRTDLLVDRPLSYCPGCGHGTAHRMLMEVIEEMDIQDKTIGVSPVGCSVLAYDFLNIDMLGAARMGDPTAHPTCIAPIPSPKGEIQPPCAMTVKIGG